MALCENLDIYTKTADAFNIAPVTADRRISAVESISTLLLLFYLPVADS
jgi:hypothetical protein